LAIIALLLKARQNVLLIVLSCLNDLRKHDTEKAKPYAPTVGITCRALRNVPPGPKTDSTVAAALALASDSQVLSIYR